MEPPLAGLDPFRLSRTLSYLMRQAAPAEGLGCDAEGWFSLDAVAAAASRAIRRPVGVEDVAFSVSRFGAARFELYSGRIRITTVWAAAPADPPAAVAAAACPDILYHATLRSRVVQLSGRMALLATGGGPVHLVRTEGHAWRVAWRQWDEPQVLYIDAARARRDGVQFTRTRAGQFCARSVPMRHILNLRAGFAEQASAGGFLVDWSAGVPRIALIRVTRRAGATWEVAKGKIEPGEAPADAAIREVREEMGLTTPLGVSRCLGSIRYGFSTPEGEPRLKTIYLYLLEATEPIDTFRPALGEGIDSVRWFGVQEAVQSMAHPSLRSAIGRLLAALDDRAAELGLAAG